MPLNVPIGVSTEIAKPELLRHRLRGLTPVEVQRADIRQHAPLAATASIAALDVLEDEALSQHAAEMGEYLLDKLDEINSPLIREVRGLGLMVGIEIKQKVAPYLQALTDRAVLAQPAGLTVILPL